VAISADREGAEWLISVRDNGIGIHPADAERIFGIFQRAHAAAEYPGTGIGLAICKTIIERHGGHIWAESCVGEGTTFKFTLPMLHHDEYPAGEGGGA
jgi:light-regulated signal transduction histidine kinase (bacteriophytochrome)